MRLLALAASATRDLRHHLFGCGRSLVLLGGWKSARRVKRAHGNVNSYSVRISEGTGVVPRWVSHVVLIGYAAIAVGAIVLVASVVT